MDQLLAIRIFVRIAESGSFGKAADLLNMPRPTVSKLIQALEIHLGVKLFQRTTRRVNITPEGVCYLEHAQRILSELDELDQSMIQRSYRVKGHLRIDTSPGLANLILIPALPAFYARYPNITLALGISDRQVDLVAEGVDCAIRGGTLADSSLIARRIGELEFATCASPDYLARYGQPQHPNELLEKHQIVGYRSATSGRLWPLLFNRVDEQIVVSSNQAIISSNDSSTHLNSLLAGLGVGQIPRFFIEHALKHGTLQTILSEWQQQRQPLQVIYPSNRHLNARLRAFIDWVTEVFAALNPVLAPPISLSKASLLKPNQPLINNTKA